MVSLHFGTDLGGGRPSGGPRAFQDPGGFRCEDDREAWRDLHRPRGALEAICHLFSMNTMLFSSESYGFVMYSSCIFIYVP